MSPYRTERKRRLDAAVLAPTSFDDHPCKNGHTVSNVGGWLICTRCGTNLGKA